MARFGRLRGGGNELQLLWVVGRRCRRSRVLLLLLRLGRQTGNLLMLLLLGWWWLLLMRLLAEMSRSFVASRVWVKVGRRLGTGAAVSRVVVVVVMVVLRGLLDVVMGVPQLSVLSDQVLHLPLEFVDALALCLDQALLVLDDSGELLQIKNGFHWIIQQALHY